MNVGVVRRSIAVVSLAALVAVLTAEAPASAASSPSPVVDSSHPLGVVAQSDGWMTYTHTLASHVHLIDSRVTVQAGKKSANGACQSSSGSGTAKAGAAASFSEEIAYNPKTCATRVISGSLSATDVSTLAQVTGGASTATASATGVKSSGGAMAPMSVSYASDFSKASWIDPINITITSLTTNLTWPLYGAGGTVSGRVNPYAFAWDGWSSSGPSGLRFVSLPNNAGWSSRETDSFTNNDFAAAIYTVLGPAGFAACGSQWTTTAHFYHNVNTEGYRDGHRGWSYDDSKDGACANLVHHGNWNGPGYSS